MSNKYFSNDEDDKKLEPCHLAGIYYDIYLHFGYEIAEKMHYYYGGQQITFPMKFYDSAYIARMIEADYVKGKSIKNLSEKYGYSERRIRQIVKKGM